MLLSHKKLAKNSNNPKLKMEKKRKNISLLLRKILGKDET